MRPLSLMAVVVGLLLRPVSLAVLAVVCVLAAAGAAINDGIASTLFCQTVQGADIDQAVNVVVFGCLPLTVLALIVRRAAPAWPILLCVTLLLDAAALSVALVLVALDAATYQGNHCTLGSPPPPRHVGYLYVAWGVPLAVLIVQVVRVLPPRVRRFAYRGGVGAVLLMLAFLVLGPAGPSLGGALAPPRPSPALRAAKLYQALKDHPIPATALPLGFRFEVMRAVRISRPPVFLGDIYERLRGPDSLDLIIYSLFSQESVAKEEITPGPGSAFLYPPTRVRAASGFGSQAVFFDRVEKGASKGDCGRAARACAIAGVVVRQGSYLVIAVTGRANQTQGNPSAAKALARSALAYLAVLEGRR